MEDIFSITLRPAVRSDIGKTGQKGIRDLFNTVQRHERRAGRAPLAPPAYADWARRMDRQIPAGPHEALVALRGNAVVGFCLARHDAKTRVTKLDKLFVHPDVQGQGIGRLLMSQVTITAQSRGQIAMTLRAESGENRASGFYQQLGYSVESRKPGRPTIDTLRRQI